MCVGSSCLFDLSLGIVSEGSHEEQITSDFSLRWHSSADRPTSDIAVQSTSQQRQLYVRQCGNTQYSTKQKQQGLEAGLKPS